MSEEVILEQGKLSALNLGQESGLHIKSIDIFTGDDEYKETECVSVTSKGSSLLMSRRIEPKETESQFRLRNEPGVRLFIEGEYGGQYVISVNHHKGAIYFKLE